MPSLRRRPRLSAPVRAAGLMVLLMLAGAAAWLIPYLREPRPVLAGVPTPPPLFAVSDFALPPHGRACMKEVTVEQNSRLAEFALRPAVASARGGPPVRLTLDAPRYEARVNVPGGYPGGSATLPIVPGPPKRATIATACFTNLGDRTVELRGSTEPRTVAHSSTAVNGHPVAGDIALAFFDSPDRSLLRQLGEAFSHASNLTEGLIPVWLIWLIAVLVAFGVPMGIALAFYGALRAEAPAPRSAFDRA